jgi:sugar lactone lactonase YvrE
VATLAGQPANEIVVDARGNIYINGADFDFVGGGASKPGYIKLATLGGQLRQAAGDVQLPNGMVITPDNQTLIISESLADRLTAFDIDPDGGLSADACSPRTSARTASPWTPKARSGPTPPTSPWSASPRAAKSCSASNWPRTGRRSR